MTTISPKDASLLALLAERPQRNSAVTKRVYFSLGSEAQKIADALRSGPDGVSDHAAQAAQGLHDWVKTNRTGRKRRK